MDRGMMAMGKGPGMPCNMPPTYVPPTLFEVMCLWLGVFQWLWDSAKGPTGYFTSLSPGHVLVAPPLGFTPTSYAKGFENVAHHCLVSPDCPCPHQIW